MGLRLGRGPRRFQFSDGGLMQLVCVPPSDVPSVLPSVVDMLRPALTRTRLGSWEALERNVLAGRALLWLAWDGARIVAAAATELQQCEGGSVCVIAACGGRGAPQWLPLLEQIEGYAKAEGCRAVRFFGRAGWLRRLRRYQQVAVVAEVQF